MSPDFKGHREFFALCAFFFGEIAWLRAGAGEGSGLQPVLDRERRLR